MIEPTPLQEVLPDSETCWALLERVAASTQLKRASRLRELLFFIGRRSLKDGCDQVHEQEIGCAVFGRPDAYDTSVDNIVRASVSDLRKRIEVFFDSEGMHEALIMEIPRGSYRVDFHDRLVQPQMLAEPSVVFAPPVTETPEAISAVAPGTSDRHPWMLAGLIAIVLLATACIALWIQYRALRRSIFAWEYEPSVAALWSNILNTRPETDVVLADSSFSLIQRISKQSFTLNDYLHPSNISQLLAQEQNPDMRSATSLISSSTVGSLNEFKLAQQIMALDPSGKKIHLYYARDYMPALIKRDNVILLGSRLANPWDELFEDRMNFVVKSDPSHTVVINHAPAVGEKGSYSETGSVGYCVVAYLPNPDHNGKVLLIEGTGPQATEAGGDFLLSEDKLFDFEKMLHVTKLPFFEVLLTTSQMKGSPLDVGIEAYRTYPNLR